MEITPSSAGWTYSGLTVTTVDGPVDLTTGESETLVLPLSGGCTVTVADEQYELTGRESVFAGKTDFVYLPRDCEATITTRTPAKIAFPSAVCENALPVRYVPAENTPVELRGAGNCSRQVNNFCTPEAFEADKLIACEVLTPGGNWSSYPPHKHDESHPGECELEEIYYFEVANGGMAYQRVYGTPDRPMDILEEVRTDDVVLIPHGWHGPSMATPGYDLYYLNVMAGPGLTRKWLITDDPAHGWIRETWQQQELDPRLPFYD
ncbi:5-deoxy-glucuronate isomerase [Actinophytocola glycyrrhizae]|uniref:5-deoxy-glucuronate isomerase n=1 Tax=Actinophytocola glycyrrhizae TaxID=2044873 RepID=A0ABV9S9L4_9PSEU